MVALTEGERLLIERRRKEENQSQAAKRYGVRFDTYSWWERDLRSQDVPHAEVGKLTRGETCYILRRRAGLTRKQVAEGIGVSSFWITQMEKEKTKSNRLGKYWDVTTAG